MADSIMTARLVVREIALERGVYATFMPKPLEGVQGSGMHTHLSLFEGDVNAFHDPGDELGLSKVGRHFIAGLLHHAPEITAVTNQLVNSYKRLVQGTGTGSQTVFEAPVFVSWGRNNQSALIRVPVVKRGKESSTRIEYRSPDPACNPYLAFSVILAAGMKGVEDGYDLPDPQQGNIFELTPEERAAEGLHPLPQSLSDALDLMERSDLVAEALGEHVHDWFLRNKRNEWGAYKAQVTPFELERYLPVW
jgi:glutamine synthetase